MSSKEFTQKQKLAIVKSAYDIELIVYCLFL